MHIERAYFYTLNRDPRAQRGIPPGESHVAAVGDEHPHPVENPFARNRGWLNTVVALSSTGDAACGLHKQRLRHTGPPRVAGVAAKTGAAAAGQNGDGAG